MQVKNKTIGLEFTVFGVSEKGLEGWGLDFGRKRQKIFWLSGNEMPWGASDRL